MANQSPNPSPVLTTDSTTPLLSNYRRNQTASNATSKTLCTRIRSTGAKIRRRVSRIGKGIHDYFILLPRLIRLPIRGRRIRKARDKHSSYHWALSESWECLGPRLRRAIANPMSRWGTECTKCQKKRWGRERECDCLYIVSRVEGWGYGDDTLLCSTKV
ncbi:hypothetical protein BCR34DRAFT_262324 [Clohesyomyces aquaticus]|uniref:Uncharacterized protein n=1 Tax=Clohesyomyces aquaticus TaxID=1231657 RepID=A0A1Y1ZTP5_9PLEO|nr:hypothetical protein BCR34DRAFT_262324 [Clohesyomyces aquaticus]